MKTCLIRYFAALIAIGVLIAGCGAEKKEVRLVCKFPQGKEYHFIYDSRKSTHAYENDSLVHSGETAHQIRYVRQVVEVIDSTKAKLRFTYTLDVVPPGEKSGTDVDTLTKTWSTEYVMTSDGKIVDFFPEENLPDESIDYYRRLFEQASPMYPDEPVSVGYTWGHTVKVLLDEGVTDASTTYKIKSFVREAGFDCAVIEYKGNMIIPLSNKCMDEGTVITEGLDRIEIEGVAYFAYVEGLVIREDESSHLIREGIATKNGKPIRFKIDEKRNYTNSLISQSIPATPNSLFVFALITPATGVPWLPGLPPSED